MLSKFRWWCLQLLLELADGGESLLQGGVDCCDVHLVGSNLGLHLSTLSDDDPLAITYVVLRAEFVRAVAGFARDAVARLHMLIELLASKHLWVVAHVALPHRFVFQLHHSAAVNCRCCVFVRRSVAFRIGARDLVGAHDNGAALAKRRLPRAYACMWGRVDEVSARRLTHAAKRCWQLQWQWFDARALGFRLHRDGRKMTVGLK